jgi:hypothetical protein
LVQICLAKDWKKVVGIGGVGLVEHMGAGPKTC